MKIRRFTARNFREALRDVKRELGPDAIILSSRETSPKGVEVMAAIDRQGLSGAAKHSVTPARVPAGSGYSAYAGDDPLGLQEAGLNEFVYVKKELQGLKEAIDEIKDSGFRRLTLPPARQKLFNFLRTRAVHEDLALRLAERAEDAEDLTGLVSSGIKTVKGGNGKKAVMLVGPTGVGKTTTVAKLAARAIRAGRRVAVISMDGYRIGAIEQIRIYAKLMGIPLEIASGVEELGESLEKFADRDMVFIDTMGRNPRDEMYINELKLLGGYGFDLQIHLLMSVSSDPAFLADAYRYYRVLPIDCIAFSKVDEAVSFGPIYNMATLWHKPVAYVTNGQRVPDDIRFPSSEALAGLVLRGGTPVGGSARPEGERE